MISEVYGMDLHPAARFGRGIMIDHGHGVVVGETAVVDDDEDDQDQEADQEGEEED
mgnify:CR=1 FL=1